MRRYHLLGLVGRGQFGEVFCAYDSLNHTVVAIKAIEQRRFSTQQFLRELRFIVTLNHPNIVSCQGITHHNSQRYLILDYCEGGTLRSLMNSGKLEYQDSLLIMMDVLAGLSQVHARGIVHCDLKPENILLTLIHSGWKAKLSDFGIAKGIGEKDFSVSMGDTGSPAYMAPERFYGKFFSVSDIYAAGIILYELIVGERPFSGTPKELIAAHMNQAPVIPKSVPFFLRSLLLRALEKLPQHRFQTAQAMQDSVSTALEIIKATHTRNVVKYSTSCLRSQVLESFSEAIVSIAAKGEELYLGQTRKILSKTGEINLNQPLIGLNLASQGCLAWCKDTHSHYLYQISLNQADLVLTIPSASLVSAVAPLGKWLSLAYNDRDPQLRLFDWHRGYYWSKSLSLLPTQILSLDNTHALVVFKTDNQSTEFKFVNRRGNWYEGFSLEIACEKLVVNRYYPYSLLGVEGDMGLLITFKPLRVSRFYLEFIPDFLVGEAWGYFLASNSGAIALLNPSGKILFREQLTLGQITAIASVSDGILLASVFENRAYLHRITW
ncbi:serine/threonine-protein kinase [Gloeocapsa sp. PCC 73106]|uniref:serine/threonine-protein kinase n=1 Tax=Gloeocapsa sp. PCC 73106 TaxID=102232 RepID=UPI0002ACE3E4|nr:serine/threonine-protein kinase [Gloeocapsa sp. PCC 73106]ELR99976.1 serine/threonine protein kinase [Gloeocapsa sp. PCC 73106]